MNKWSRNSIYGAGLASLLYLGCGNSVQNKDIKVQEDIDLGLADTNLDDYVSSDLDYCSSLEINSPEWCEECNTPPVLENAYLRDPKPSYAIGEDIYVCVEASDPEGDELICMYSNGPKWTENNCTECGWIDFFVEGPQTIWTWAEDTCNNQSEAYLITIEIKDDV